jgi:hypothetical protein
MSSVGHRPTAAVYMPALVTPVFRPRLGPCKSAAGGICCHPRRSLIGVLVGHHLASRA